jgi:capsular exopolysaccharide synthesis family protein
MMTEMESNFEGESNFDDEGTDDLISAAIATSSLPAPKAHLDGKSEEIFRGMWASLFYSGRTTGKTVLISSAARKEGTSTVACGLALSGSGPAGGARVALVDFNLRNPALHKILGLAQSPGVADVLVKGQDIESAAKAVNDNLDVYTVGDIGKQSLGLLRSEVVEKFFAQLAEKYDYVLVDSAATNHFPDSQVLAGVLKEVVLVVHSDLTPREAVSQAKKRILSGGGKLAGLVMNMRTYPIPKFLYNRV